MLLPWRRKVMARLEALLPSERLCAAEANIDAIINHLTYVERRMDEKMDGVMKHVDDVVAYAASVVDAVKQALDYLRAHQGDDAAAKEFADHVDAKMKELEDKLHEVGASGGVA